MAYRPIQLPSQSAPKLNTTVYTGFHGIDYANDPIEVNISRSPSGKNFICESNGTVSKRLGWRVLETLDSPINGLYHAVLNEQEIFLAHAGNKLYRFVDGNSVVIKSDLNNAKSSGFYFDVNGSEAIYILTGREFLKYDGTSVVDATENPYVPIIAIGSAPTGGGEYYEYPNLLGAKRTQQFIGTDADKTFQLIEKALDASPVTVNELTNNGTIDLVENVDYTVNRQLGTVTFVSAHPTPIAGRDNIFITYSKTVSGEKDKIVSSTICTTFGLYGGNQVFVTGNPSTKAVDYWSGVGDPSYFPDVNYVTVGEPDCPIMGYATLGGTLAIVKGVGTSRAVYIRTPMLNGSNVDYLLQETSVNYGAKLQSIVNMPKEALFLSDLGIVGIGSENEQIIVKNRSFFMDNKMKYESGGCIGKYKEQYIYCVNGIAYVLETKYAENTEKDTSNYGYRCYLWDNIHANLFLEVNGSLYFGTEDGRVCRFNDDINDVSAYTDGGTQSSGIVSGGIPINFIWSTKNDNDGSQIMKKEMQAENSSVVFKSSIDGEIIVKLMSDGALNETIIFPFEGSSDYPYNQYIKKTGKEYTNRQIIIEHNNSSDFELIQINKTFATVGYGGE